MDYYGGVTNRIDWNDSSSIGSFTYGIKRGTTSDPSTAVTIATNIPAAVRFYEDTSAVSGQTYYYFIEVTDGTHSVLSTGKSVVTVADSHNKVATGQSYRSSNYASLTYNPETDSFM